MNTQTANPINQEHSALCSRLSFLPAPAGPGTKNKPRLNNPFPNAVATNMYLHAMKQYTERLSNQVYAQQALQLPKPHPDCARDC